MNVLSQHPDLASSQRQRLSQGEAFGRHLFTKTADALDAEIGCWENKVDFDRVFEHYRRAVAVVRPLGTLMLIETPADDAAAWVLVAEETYLIEVRLFWCELRMGVAEDAREGAHPYQPALDRMMEATQRAVLPQTVRG